MEKYPNYVPPLPVGFGWSEDEEDDFTDQPSSTYRQTTPSFSHFQLEPNTSLNNKNNLNNNYNTSNKMLQIEELVEKNRQADQQDLINLEQSGIVISFEENTSLSCPSSTSPLNSKLKYHPLPLQSIAYDYTCLPLRIVEQERKFLPLIGEMSSPFLRPILVDGIGLIKAYWEGCSEDDEDGNNGNISYLRDDDRSFPIIPIIRCLFYWVSRGHLTKLCFPIDYNPIANRQEYAVNDQNLKTLKQLEIFGIALFFDSNSVNWFADKKDSIRACLITSMVHYVEGMPSSLRRQNYSYKTWSETHMCSERTLQPYYGPRGDLVFFSPIKGVKKEFVTDTVLDNDIKTEEEFRQFERFQLRFITQAKHLKILYDLLPKEKRAQEAHVMVALLNRLEWHLTH